MTRGTKHAFNLATGILGVILIALFAVFFVRALAVGTAAAYRIPFIVAILITLTMETRVRLGLRLPRGPLFYTHLFASIVSFLLLALLAFVMRPAWLQYLSLVLFFISLAAGLVLLYRGIHTTVRERSAQTGDGIPA